MGGAAVVSVDVVLCLGDSLNMSTADQSSRDALITGESDLSQVLTCLENIKCRVLYIPGNVRRVDGCVWEGGGVASS